MLALPKMVTVYWKPINCRIVCWFILSFFSCIPHNQRSAMGFRLTPGGKGSNLIHNNDNNNNNNKCNTADTDSYKQILRQFCAVNDLNGHDSLVYESQKSLPDTRHETTTHYSVLNRVSADALMGRTAAVAGGGGGSRIKSRRSGVESSSSSSSSSSSGSARKSVVKGKSKSHTQRDVPRPQQVSNKPTTERLLSKVGTSIESSPTLVLNADYTPLSHIPLSLWHWQDSLRAVLSGKAVVVSEYNDVVVRSVSASFPLPSVIALKRFQKKPTQVPVMTRKYLLLRDDFQCQYCGDQFSPRELTLDHVFPRSKGGKLTWRNTVCACQDCNYKKGSTLPQDLRKLGMKLRREPYEPSITELQYKGRQFKRNKLHPHWEDFI
mmetsp:Transcript_19508/g.32605  ORF Transcript_19508/g.32605 Transcript_19508/m.32605 type:complete len:379 (-) Transcript_19508:323-1459(-)